MMFDTTAYGEYKSQENSSHLGQSQPCDEDDDDKEEEDDDDDDGWLLDSEKLYFCVWHSMSGLKFHSCSCPCLNLPK